MDSGRGLHAAVQGHERAVQAHGQREVPRIRVRGVVQDVGSLDGVVGLKHTLDGMTTTPRAERRGACRSTRSRQRRSPLAPMVLVPNLTDDISAG